MARRLAVVLGVPVDDVTLPQAVHRIELLARQRRRLRQVATANTDFVVRALGDPELRRILREADLVTADGMPVVWAARLLGARLRERVAGADLVPALAEQCARIGLSLYLLGAMPETAQSAACRLRERYPGLRIAGVYSPPLSDLEGMDNDAILRRINVARPDILLVAFGNPKQEKWIHRHREALDVGVAIGIGGTLDFIAGRVARAPRWVQRAGMEWAWRLGREPGRLWRRYAHDAIRFLPGVAARWAQGALVGRGGRRVSDVRADSKGVLHVRGYLGAGSEAALRELAERGLRRGAHVAMDLAECRWMDAAGLGSLLQLAGQAAGKGGSLSLRHVSPRLARLLEREGMDRSFRMEVTR